MTDGRHLCPGLEAGPASARLEAIVRAEPWLLRALDAVAESALPDAWIGAGAMRDVVWGRLYGSFDPAEVKDVDVAYFDPGNGDLRRGPPGRRRRRHRGLRSVWPARPARRYLASEYSPRDAGDLAGTASPAARSRPVAGRRGHTAGLNRSFPY
jgi:Nucleotidyltransferase